MDMYYFRIGVHDKTDAVIYSKMMRKAGVNDTAAEIDKLIAGDTGGWESYGWPGGFKPASELDLAFAGGDKCKLVFEICEPTANAATEFEKNPIKRLKIRGFRNTNFIAKKAISHKVEGKRLWASVIVDCKKAREAIENEYPDHSADGKPVMRFPFVFNFVDPETGLSPAIKQPHRHKAADKGPQLNDGRIHPEVVANVITITG